MKTNTTNTDYRTIIKNEFDYRKSNNNSYSLRSFARDLGMSPSRLSEVLARKGGLSLKKGTEIAKLLGLNAEEIKYFQSLVLLEQAHAYNDTEKLKNSIDSFQASQNFKMLSNEVFRVVSDWYYFAILTVMELNDYDGSCEWIAKRLGLDLSLVQSAIETMMKLNLVVEHENRFTSTNEDICTTTDISNRALRISHKQTLDQAKKSIDEVSVERRDISSMTMAIDKNKIPEAKKRIKEFRRELARFLESGEKNTVYNLNIQLHPLTND